VNICRTGQSTVHRVNGSSVGHNAQTHFRVYVQLFTGTHVNPYFYRHRSFISTN